MKKLLLLALSFLLTTSVAEAQQIVLPCVQGTANGSPVGPCNPVTSSNPLPATIVGGISGGVNLGTSTTITNPQRIGDVTTGLFSNLSQAVAIANGGQVSLNTTQVGVTIGSSSVPANTLDIYGGTGIALGTYAGTTSNVTGGLVTSGQVGIGTNSPISLLDIIGTNDATLRLVAGGSWPLIFDQSSFSVFTIKNANSSVAFAINGSNQIGIGSSVPRATLDVSQATDAEILPIGVGTQRPSPAVNGMIRYNSGTPAVEAYVNNVWTSLAGTVTSIATTAPITGGTITTTGTIACATCVTSTSPGAGIAHFAGSTQNVTSSAVSLTADVSGILPVANGGTNAGSASITALNNITGFSFSGLTGNTSTYNLVGSNTPTLTTPNFSGTATGNNTHPLTLLAQVGTNTVLGNSTSGTANVTALSVGGCSSASSALIWTTNTGFGCNTSITATTNANLTGVITSSGNATSIASQTGTGTKFVVDTTPTFTTNITVPLIIGGSTTTNNLVLENTSSGQQVAIGSTTVGIGTSTQYSSTVANFNGRVIATGGSADPSDGSPKGVTISYDTNNDQGDLESIQTGVTGKPLEINGHGNGAVYIHALAAANSANVTIGGIVSISGALFLPGISSSTAAQNGTLCWATGGNITYDPSLGCLTSLWENKRDIQTIKTSTALNEVMKLKPSTYFYNYKDVIDKQEQIGLIAQEVEKVDSKLVAYDEKGKLRGVRYNHLGPLAIAAIQEQQKEIEHLSPNEFPWHKCFFNLLACPD